jgi:hypothetical protein
MIMIGCDEALGTDRRRVIERKSGESKCRPVGLGGDFE